MFAKAPRAGLAKRRLASELGEPEALRIYNVLLKTVLHSIADLSPVELRITPDDADEDFQELLRPGWTITAQGTGDLGVRLTRAFEEAFRNGATRVVAIGSDCPSITANDIESAWSALKDHDVVLGPATDGGYWLIGMRRFLPELFRDIEWSTSSVFEETSRRARIIKASLTALRTLTDVDTVEDVEAHPCLLRR